MSKEEVVEAPDGTLEQGEFKIKKKPKNLVTEKKVTKVDLAKKEDAIPKKKLKLNQQLLMKLKKEVKVEKVVEETEKLKNLLLLKK